MHFNKTISKQLKRSSILIFIMLLSACTIFNEQAKPQASSVNLQKLNSNYRVYPYLQNPSQTAITVLWFTDLAESGALTYQKQGTGELTNLVSSYEEVPALTYSEWDANHYFNGNPPTAPFRQRVRIEGLEPATTYDYTVVQEGESFSSSFRTAPLKNAPIRAIIYGDCETEPESTGKHTTWKLSTSDSKRKKVSKSSRKYFIDQTQGYQNNLTVIKSRNPDLVVIAGDLVQSGGEQQDWDEFWIQNNNSSLRLASSTPIMPTFGNHEYYAGPNNGHSEQPASENAAQKYLSYFEVPSNQALIKQHEERYYSLNYGPAIFIILDVTNNSPENSSSDTSFYLNGTLSNEENSLQSFSPGFSPDSRQYQWLEETLKEAQKQGRFIFITTHHAPYSSGPHGRPPGFINGTDPQSGIPVRDLTPLFMQYGVDAVFSGHDEMWERSSVSGNKIMLSGVKQQHTIQFYDVGIGGDGLRKPLDELDNPFQRFVASDDAPEIWENDELISGGRHYGHLELDIDMTESNGWQATLKPVYLLPTKDDNGEYNNYIRKVYDDEIIIIKSAAD